MNILLEGQEVKYESLSGGEKRRVDLSLIFGLNRWVSEKYLVPNGILGLIILDECFSYLDVSGSEVVAQLLLEEGNDRSIFVIDHSLSLSSYAINIWTVVKENGVSTLRIN
jgi:DNA repair exonuclease SbcCD ATPase subunit